MWKKLLLLGIAVGGGALFLSQSVREEAQEAVSEAVSEIEPVSFAIAVMRNREFPGSEVIIEESLGTGSNYNRYITSYKSDDLKIYGLLTVPTGKAPEKGWPVIIFNHGYIPPDVYKTTERYVAYVDGFARQGYVVFKPDYRGHGESEGDPTGAYYSDGYTTDVLNAFYSVRNHELKVNGKSVPVNKDAMGMWGHSMGGSLTLRSMVVSKDIKAGVSWAGVVGSYDSLMTRWRRARPWMPSTPEQEARRKTREDLLKKFGTPSQNPAVWNAFDPIAHVADISGPMQLHHGIKDDEVPWEFSEELKNKLEEAGKEVEYYTYEGADHNLSGTAFGLAMQRSVEFFDRYLKG